MAYNNNETAVSPIVATLVLIVVAVIGAVAVGTIMGSFSSDVSKKASAGQAAQASSTDILIAGSNPMHTAVSLVAADYMAQNPGITIDVQRGGSSAGLSSVVNGVADIGLSTWKLNSAQTSAYPNVRQYIVGYDAVVPIVNIAVPVTSNVTYSDLERAYSNDFTGPTLPAGITQSFINDQRDGLSDTFASLIGVGNIYSTQNASTIIAINNYGGPNGAAIMYIANNTNTIGFTDIESALNNQNVVRILDYAGTPKTHETDTTWPTYTWQSVRDAKNGVSNPLHFPDGAIVSLELLTNGQPSSLDQSIISFMQSPNKAAQFHDDNLVHVSDIVTM